MRTLLSLLDAWEEHAEEPGGRPEAARALLSAAESADPRTPAPLWHRFLDATRRPRYLTSLPARADRHRWAEAAFAAVRASRYTLATMLGQRVGEHPGRALFQESPLPGAPLWSYEEVSRRLERTAAAFLRARKGKPRVAILSANGLDGACADLACLVHGIPVAPVNPEADPEALGWILDRLRVNVVVAETDELRARAERAPGAPPHVAFLLDPAAPLRGAAEAGLAEAGRPRPGPGAEGTRGPGAAAARRAGDRDVHVRQHRAAEGRRAHRPRPRDEALRAGGRAPRGGRGRGAALLPAALPHLRPLPRDDRHALLGRHLRLRRQPILRDPGPGPARGAAHRARRRPPPLGAAARALPRPGRGRRVAPRGRGRPPALGALRRRPPRPRRLPLLPEARRRALQRVRHDGGYRRDHHDPARRVRGRIGGRPPARDRGPALADRGARDRRPLRGPLPRGPRARVRREALAPHRGHLRAPAERPLPDRRPGQGRLQEHARPDGRAGGGGTAARRRAGSEAGIPRGRRPRPQRAPDRARPARPRPLRRDARRGGGLLLRARDRGQPGRGDARARGALRRPRPRLRPRARADPERDLPPEGSRGASPR